MLRIANEIRTGQNTIGATAVAAIPGLGMTPIHGIRIRAAATNAGLIYVGRAGVTAATGFELGAGQEIDIEIDDRASLHVIASIASQKYSWLAR